MDGFLKARAEEVVHCGLVVVPGRPNEVPHSECIGNVSFEVLGSCLLDMDKEGKIEDGMRIEGLPHIAEPETKHAAERLTIGIRVGVEAVFKGHLEDEIIDELFDSYCKRLEEVPSLFSSGGAAILNRIIFGNGFGGTKFTPIKSLIFPDSVSG
ncbi:probable S-adenosylmethionine-dependent methyltransferase [Tanacetum coccineum]